MRSIAPSIFLACAVFALSGCKDDATRAEEFYRSGMELLEQGDKERALIELRNVFKYDGFHQQARNQYADILLESGNKSEAYSQYLRLIEQYPDLVDVRVTLANLALERRDNDEFQRHSEAAVALAPERDDVKALNLMLQYSQAVRDDDESARDEIFAKAQSLLAEIRATQAADNDGLMRLSLDHLMLREKNEEALAALEQALDRNSEDPELNLLKAQLLRETGKEEALGAQLQKLSELLPGNILIKNALVNWYLSQEEPDQALAYLRDLAGDDAGPVEKHREVIGLLASIEGQEAAREETGRLAKANAGTENGRYYEAMLANGLYEDGEHDRAIEKMRAIIEASETGAQKNQIRMSLVGMLNSAGKQEEADKVVEAILQDDSSNVQALQAKASRLILSDKPGEAILSLRSALDQDPQNPDTLTLMAQAHQRDGDANLAAERLALAMKASGNALPQTLRYAKFLIDQDREQAALSVLEGARSSFPNSSELLRLLVAIYIDREDWPLAQEIARHIRSIDTQAAQQMAAEIDAVILSAQGRPQESVDALTSRYENQSALDVNEKVRTGVLIVRSYMQNGEWAKARTTLDEMLTQYSVSSDLKLLDANLEAQMGDIENATKKYRALIEQYPNSAIPVRLFAIYLERQGQATQARQLVEEGLERIPGDDKLRIMLAGYEERDGNVDAAITIYEDLYAKSPNDRIVANNLASLIASHSEEEDSLARAAQIANQLRGAEVAAFQDTYGWIAFRRGNVDEALQYLEPAAKSLSTDPSVQFHLAMAYDALEREEEAAELLQNALNLWGDRETREKAAAASLLSSYEGGQP